jgi:uncharacterized membrane protein
MAEKLKSRKLWLAIVGAIFVVLNDQFGWGFTKDAIDSVLKFFALFIATEGAKDVAAALKNRDRAV